MHAIVEISLALLWLAGTPTVVDRIEDTTATVCTEYGCYETDTDRLPPGAREGSCVQGGAIVACPDDGTEALRARLGRGDTGADIEL